MLRRCLPGLTVVLIFVSQPSAANPSVTGIVAITGALIGWAATHPASVPAGNGSYVFGVGAFDRVDRLAQTLDFSFERRWGEFEAWRFKPFAGIGATGRRSLYVYGGLRLDMNLVAKLNVEPSLAVAGYFHGGGKDLGSPVEFRSGIDVNWRFADGLRLGLAYHHFSHWILFGSNNPGTEILAITLAVPVR